LTIKNLLIKIINYLCAELIIFIYAGWPHPPSAKFKVRIIMENTRDSYIFYRSFYEAINDLPDKEQLEIYQAISSYSLDFKEIKLTGISRTILTLIKPQLEANKKRYLNGTKGAVHGAKGGRPKTPSKPQDKPLINPKLTPNKNVNVNKNVNLNVNKNKDEIKEGALIKVIPNFIDADNWNEFLLMRKKAKAPPTEKAIKLIIKDLTKFESGKSGNANLALENSIKNNWKGVFEPKQDSTNKFGVNF
jgi:hypothetical protein